MDATTAQGMSTDVCAKRIVDALLNEEKDLMICDLQAKAGFWLRIMCPPLYYWVMEKRALKLHSQK